MFTGAGWRGAAEVHQASLRADAGRGDAHQAADPAAGQAGLAPHHQGGGQGGRHDRGLHLQVTILDILATKNYCWYYPQRYLQPGPWRCPGPGAGVQHGPARHHPAPGHQEHHAAGPVFSVFVSMLVGSPIRSCFFYRISSSPVRGWENLFLKKISIHLRSGMMPSEMSHKVKFKIFILVVMNSNKNLSVVRPIAVNSPYCYVAWHMTNFLWRTHISIW